MTAVSEKCCAPENNSRKESRPMGSATVKKLILVVLVLFVGALIFLELYKNEDVRSALSPDEPVTIEQAFQFSYDSQTKSAIAPLDGGIAVASTTGVQIYSKDGSGVAVELYTMSEPAIVESGGICAVWDIGAENVRIFNAGGLVRVIQTELPVINVSIYGAGWISICARKSGYKGAVTVYNAKLTEEYRWNSSKGYLIDAAVSEDNSMLAAATVAQDSLDFVSRVKLFKLDSEEEYASYEIRDSLVLSISWMTSGRLCVVAEDRVIILDRNGLFVAEYDYSDLSLVGFTEGGDAHIAIVLSRYSLGSRSQLVLIDEEGTVAASTDLGDDFEVISAAGKYIAVLYSDELVIYDNKLSEFARSGYITGIKQAVMLSDGSALLAGNDTAALFAS